MNRRAKMAFFIVVGVAACLIEARRGNPHQGLTLMLSMCFFVVLLHLEELYERVNALELEKVHASDKRGKRRVG